MTANLVTGLSPVKELKPGAAANLSPTSGTDFSDVLKNSTDKGNDVNVPQPKEPVKDKISKSEEDSPGTESKVEQTKTKDDSSKSVKETDKELASDKPLDDKVTEEIAEAVGTMVITIANVLDVPVTDVTQAMEDLNISEVEILEPNTIPNLVVELTDAVDVTEITTNEELFADVKQLMTEVDNTVKEVADTLQIPVEDVKSLISDKAAEAKDGTEISEVIITDTKIVREDSNRRDSLTVSEQTDPQIVAEDSEEIAPVSARHTDDKRQDNEGSRNNNGEHLNFTQTVTDTLKEMVAEKISEPTVSYTATTDQIMEQVSDSLRMTMNEDITEMEMQLHPASLGNVRVQVAAKDGVITASFTTENQQVKEVLEAQVIQLKEQMNEQGIKIEAVEVTVSSHAFERNLNDNGQNRNGQPEAEAKKKRVRGINLGSGGIEELDMEELDEEDKVTADMMARQGNTVDYMA
ncbi:MAG: flagellar hook-length control protein FliK [Lachnospiraceae bacterium]|nr:flagellar hook-length control protein FliK [Lachnospiraceae bacterium]